MTHTLVKGTTAAQDFQLTDDGEPLDGTGHELSIEFSAGSVDATSAVEVAWLEQASGTARMTGTGDLPVGDHQWRWKLTDGEELVGYIPNLEKSPNILCVVKV